MAKTEVSLFVMAPIANFPFPPTTSWTYTELLVPTEGCSASYLVISAVRSFLELHLITLVTTLQVALAGGITVLTVPALLSGVVATLGFLLGLTLPNLLTSTLLAANCLGTCLTSGPIGAYCDSLAVLVSDLVGIVNSRVLHSVINALLNLHGALLNPFNSLLGLNNVVIAVSQFINDVSLILSPSNMAALDIDLQKTVHDAFQTCCVKALEYHP
jgi:hypothetical protein